MHIQNKKSFMKVNGSFAAVVLLECNFYITELKSNLVSKFGQCPVDFCIWL